MVFTRKIIRVIKFLSMNNMIDELKFIEEFVNRIEQQEKVVRSFERDIIPEEKLHFERIHDVVNNCEVKIRYEEELAILNVYNLLFDIHLDKIVNVTPE